MSLLEVERASSFYGDFQALYDISLAVEEGERFAVIGSNGAGKSTLLRMIAGLLPARGGSIRFDGRPVDALRVHERVGLGISMVPEGRRIFPSLSVEENLLVGGYRRGRRRGWDRQRVYDLFPLLRDRAGRSAAVLSGGEQQALAIGRALMNDPRLLLLDEVSLGLAPIVIRDLYERLPAISEAGTTVLIVEQNVDQALAFADRVTCLLEGRISLQGRSAELSRPAVAAAYFGV
jgi:branched-chain amino acid transport system ATP-binding protein